MKKMIALILALAVLMSLTACGGTGADSASVSAVSEAETSPSPAVSEEAESWGSVAAEASPESPTETENQEEENEFGTMEVPAPVQDDETIAELKEIIMALVMCDFADGMQFAPQDSMFFWRAMNYYAASVCYSYEALSEDMSWAVFSEEAVLYFAKRMFGGVESLPELLDTGMIEKWDTGEYAFMLGNYGDVALELGEIQPSDDGTYTVEAKLGSGTGEALGSWTISLTILDDEYCVTGILYG